jgi:predicted RNA-binding Zn ribbon-like protein
MMLVMPAGPDQSAPGELEFLRAFVNTFDAETGEEELADGDAAATWFRERDVPIGPEAFDEAELERLIAVRQALRKLLLANNTGDAAPRAALATLNEQSAESNIGLHFGPAGADLVTRCDGVECAIARMLSIAHESMRAETWSRLKVCPADDCFWAFYDHSRNRSGTWCTMEVCGNRAKARSYRQRSKAKAQTAAKGKR